MEPTSPERWADGPSILESVWRFRWHVLAVTAVLGVFGYLISAQQEPVYEASTQLYLTDPRTAGVFGQQSSNVNLESYVPQQSERITSTPVLAAAVESLDADLSVTSLRRKLEVEGDPDLGTVEIAAQDGSAERAAAIANAVAEAYQEAVRSTQLERSERAATELQGAAEEIEAQIQQLGELAEEAEEDDFGEAGAAASIAEVQIGVLTQRLLEIDGLAQQLRVDARLFGSGVEFAEEATAPTSPVAPKPRRTAAGSALLGALLSAAVAYWLAGRGRRIEDRDEPSEILGVPLLGVLPTYDVTGVTSLRERAAIDPRTAEAYRFVYSSLDLVLRGLSARSVMITSASPGAGKTETALQLAFTAHSRGRDVLLVDGDLRMRGLSSFLGATRSPGLLDLVDSYDPSFVARYRFADDYHLAVLTAGTGAGDAAEQLREAWFGRVFPAVVVNHDLTLIDSPPLLAVAEASTIAAHTDAVVLVVREGSPREDLERAQQRMRFVGQRIVGYVYLTPSALDDTDFDYGLVRAESWRSNATPSQPSPSGTVRFPATGSSNVTPVRRQSSDEATDEFWQPPRSGS